MDIFGVDFEYWITLDRYGNAGVPEQESVTAFMNSDDCLVSHYNYIMGYE